MKTFWTIQHRNSLRYAISNGYLTGNKEYIDELMLDSYEWLISKMITYLECKHSYPIWMWDQKPDLRKSGWGRGKEMVLLEIELDEHKTLKSDYNTWHFVLNDWTLQVDEEEIIDKNESWNRIFDFDYLTKNSEYFGMPIPQYIIPQINITDIKTTRNFIAK